MDLSLVNGDVNGDNSVNVSDFFALRAAFRKSFGQLGYYENADLDGSGSVGVADFLILHGSFGPAGA